MSNAIIPSFHVNCTIPTILYSTVSQIKHHRMNKKKAAALKIPFTKILYSSLNKTKKKKSIRNSSQKKKCILCRFISVGRARRKKALILYLLVVARAFQLLASLCAHIYLDASLKYTVQIKLICRRLCCAIYFFCLLKWGCCCCCYMRKYLETFCIHIYISLYLVLQEGALTREKWKMNR